jgi:hypothetical protein
MMHVLLVLSLLGLTTSTIYTLLVVSGALHFAQRRRTAEPHEFTPPVSLLKPLHGLEQGLEFRLESFFRQVRDPFLCPQRSGPCPIGRHERGGALSAYSNKIPRLR